MQMHQLPYAFLSSQVTYFSSAVEINSRGTRDQQKKEIYKLSILPQIALICHPLYRK